MKKSMIGLACSALFATSAGADDSATIFSLYEQFVVAGAAASKCAQPASADLEKFTANLMLVGKLVGQELERRNPSATQEQLLSTMNKRTNDLTAKTYDMVKARGCQDPDVQKIVRGFQKQVDWKPATAVNPGTAGKPGAAQ